MSLDKYKEKRNFSETSEPEGSSKKVSEKHVFVVQRHAATKLHYDFRLEMEGVLKSWAVPKGPSLNPGDKRLAVRVEDHPFEYRTFEGSIPKGNYGAGEVEIWDHGTYEPLHREAGRSDEEILLEGVNKNSLKIIMNGEKLKGEFTLFKIHKTGPENAWLLVKHKDNYAVAEPYDAEEYTSTKSEVTKLAEKKYKNYQSPHSTQSGNNEQEQEQVKNILPKDEATFIKPMLAELGGAPFDNEDWIFEIKWDGYRAIADLTETPLLYSRNGISFSEKYPPVFSELKLQKQKMVLDGEIVAYDDKGRPDFQTLQHFAGNNGNGLVYQVFDLLYLNGYNTRELPLLQRKELLKEALIETSHIKYCDHIVEKGIDFFNAARDADLEGVMAKKKNSIYQDSVRSHDWQKIKNHKIDEAVIAGYTEPRGSRKYFGSLILGQYKNGELVYAGHVGTGFNDEVLRQVYDELQPFVTGKMPFSKKPPVNMPPTWLHPVKVCNIKYAGITEDGIFRHPVFQGIREDKNAIDLYEEHAAETSFPDTSSPSLTKTNTKKMDLKFTNLDKLYWKKEKITKGDLIDYYLSISDYILPHLKDRAQSLHRFPQGIDGLSFYHKDAGKDAPSWVETVKIMSESNEKEIEYIVCNNKETLGYLINLGCIELNPWNNRVTLPDNPDYLIIDLDPSANNTFSEVIKVALTVKDVLDIAGIKGFCKTSGSTGIHVLIPAGALYSYEQIRDFAHLIMQLVEHRLPELTTLERMVNKRNGRIYLDYMQNKVGQTIASVYSVRPKRGATVSMPLEWEELNSDLAISDFTIYNALERIKEKGEMFAQVLTDHFDMEEALSNLQRQQ